MLRPDSHEFDVGETSARTTPIPAVAVRRLRSVALPIAIGLGVFGLALDSGGYAIAVRNPVAIGIWWTIVLAVGTLILPVSRIPRAALVTGGALAVFAFLAGLSIAWSDSAELAFNEFNRVMLYLGVFVLVVLAARRGSARSWTDGLAIGIAGVGLLALTSRFFPHLVGNQGAGQFLPTGQTFLNYPLDYWNGLGIFLGLGVPLLLRAGVGARLRALRGLAVGVVPALATAMYLTSSRGGAATAALATLAFVALTNRRLAALGAVAVAGAGSAAAVAVVAARSALVNGPLGGHAAISQGRGAALLVALVCIAAGVAYALASRLRVPAPTIGRRGRIVLAVAAVAVVAAGVAASNPAHRWDQFKAPPTDPFAASTTSSGASTYTSGSHLTSSAGNGRWQMWQGAVDEFKSRPLIGRGAGSYQAWWAKHGSVSYFTRDTHSLYLQTLGELGVLGGVVLLVLLGSAVPPVVRRLRASPANERGTVAALAAVCIGFAFAAAIDWMWQLTVVAVVAVVALALLTGPATLYGDEAAPEARGGRLRRFVPRAAVVVVGLALMAASAIPFLAQMKISESQRQVARGNLSGALADAQSARRTQPWASSPYLQLALVRQRTGDITGARSAIRHSIVNDPADWQPWLVSANIERQAGNQAAARRDLEHAASLNPRSSLFTSLRSGRESTR